MSRVKIVDLAVPQGPLTEIQPDERVDWYRRCLPTIAWLHAQKSPHHRVILVDFEHESVSKPLYLNFTSRFLAVISKSISFFVTR